VNLGGSVSLKLQRVADQVLEDLRQVRRVGMDNGKRIMGHFRVMFTDGRGEIMQNLLKYAFTVGLFKGLVLRADSGIFQQVTDESLHAGGPIHGVPDKFIGVFVEFSLIPFAQ